MNDDFFELPSEDIDINDNKGKQNREDGLDLLFKILDKEEIQYDTVSDGKRNFINNQIGILGDYKLAISVDPNTDMKKFYSYLNKELIKYGCHISRDNYNTLTLSYDKSLIVKEQEMRNYNAIVFDIGGVLIEREEIDLRDLRKLGIYDEVELRQLMIIYYDIANDNDTATYKEILSKYKKALPDRFKSKAKELIDLSIASKRVCKHTVPLLKELKSKGYKLYYLSNASKHRYEVYKKNNLLNFLEYFDGGLISYKEGVEKPNPEFYNRLLRKYKLKAPDCLFIDDNPNNIETAQNLGFKTLYYNNPKNIDLYSIIESAELELPENEVINEVNIFVNEDNIECNCDTLAPNTNNNILFITGYSGAGKSTLMANLNEKYGNNIMTVAGDVFFFVCRHKYRVDNGITVSDKHIAQYGFTNVTSRNFMGPVLARYFDFYYDEIKLSNDLFRNKELFRYWVHFVKWLYKDTAVNKVFYRNKIIVVEGIQISNTDPELYKDHALIIVGTSALTAWSRKAKRDIIIPSKYDWKHIKTLLTMIPVYANDYKRLNNLEKIMGESTELELPEDNNTLEEILNNTNPNKIYFTSDWHLFKNHYKHEANYVNTQKIIKWCKENIKDNDVFFYLGDISFRWANEEDQKESMGIMASLPGIKVLILGNHDKMLGQDYFTNCGFKYVFEEYQWKDYIFTHKPINMSMYQDNMLNIHGHIHNMETYNTTDGKRNVNVYPMWFDNKPVTLDYIINHVDELTKNHSWNWNAGYNEATVDFNSDIFNSVIELNNKLSNMQYGILMPGYTKIPSLDKRNYNTTASDWDKYYRLASPTKFIKQNGGTCWDYVCFEDFWLDKYTDLNHACYYIESRVSDDLPTHTICIFEYNDIYYYIESSFKRIIGVYYSNSINDLISFSLDMMDKYSDCSGRYELIKSPYYVYQYKANDTRMYDMSCVAFMQHVYTNGRKINFKYNPNYKISKYVPTQISESKRSELLGFSNRYTKININSDNILKYKNKCSSLKHIKDDAKGYIYLDSDDNVAALIAINDKDGNKWITALEIFGSAKGNGLSYKLLDVAVKEFKATHLSVKKTNSIAKHVYDKYGFVVYDSTDTMYFMKLGSNVNEAKRSELPDSSFGIPEDRKYPLDTEQHVRSAIKLFGHAEESKKKSLAKRINAAVKKYDISIPETTQCYKYLSEGGFYDMIPEDITTIVFDMGGVLVDSDLEGTIHNGLHVSHLLAHEIQDLILDNILCCEPKDKRIKTCSLDCIKKYFYNIAPDNIKPYTDDVLRLLNNALFKYAYVDELISILKAKGYSIYYLSNWFGWSYELEKEFFAPLLSKFDGGLFSFETNYEKPQEEFYKIFFNKFNLDPKTCLFFDDKAENISAGERLGMRGIIFNPEETPKQLLDGNFNIPSDANNKILVSNGVNLEAVNISQIRWWHCSKYNNLNDFNHYDNNEFYRTIDEAIKKNTIESDYANGPIERYLYSYTGDMDEDYYQRFIVGAIQVNPDYTYEWTIQYPLESDEDGNLTSRLSEWAMASCNPIKGISKPFILKVTPDNNSTINPKLYAFSPDIIADKYLVVNENAQLEIVDSNRFNNCVIESYEFIGDNQEYLVNKIYKAYKEHKIVDNTFFYTTLTGKPMLCEDQIDYDTLFSKVNVDLIVENISTELATFKEQVTNIIYNTTTTLPVLESVANKVSFANHYKDIIMKEDIDGYYFYNSLTGKRTRSIKDIKSLTETMIISTL